MNSEQFRARTRLALEQWFVIVVVALLAVSLFGGWMAYSAYADDGDDQTEPRTVEAWSTTGGFDHSAEVIAENEVFAVGTDLEDRSAYFSQVTPELEGEFRYGYDATSGDVDVDVELERVVRAVEEDDEETIEHWSVAESLETTTSTGLEPGEETTTPFAVDVPAMANESERIEESLGSSPGDVETVVVAHVTMVGTIEGEAVERTEAYELEIDAGDDTYAVDGPEAVGHTEERTETVTVSDSSGTLSAIGGLAVFVAGLGGLGALTVARSRGTLTPPPRELEALRRATEREEFDDWISRGTVPEDLGDRSRVEVETLEDLVDVAIDCDRRVIEDAGGYYVLDDELVYVYGVGDEDDLEADDKEDLFGADDEDDLEADDEDDLEADDGEDLFEIDDEPTDGDEGDEEE